MSLATEYRSAARLDIAFEQIRSSSLEIFSSIDRIGRGSRLRTCSRTSSCVVPVNGRRPVSNTYITTPKLKMSARPSTRCASPRACSGDIYEGVPASLAPVPRSCSRNTKPKSAIMGRSSSLSINTFPGLMSRCTIPCLCA